MGCVNTRPVTTSMGCDTVPHSGYLSGSGALLLSPAASSPPLSPLPPSSPPPPSGPWPLPPPASIPAALTATLGHIPGSGPRLGKGAVRAIAYLLSSAAGVRSAGERVGAKGLRIQHS